MKIQSISFGRDDRNLANPNMTHVVVESGTTAEEAEAIKADVDAKFPGRVTVVLERQPEFRALTAHP